MFQNVSNMFKQHFEQRHLTGVSEYQVLENPRAIGKATANLAAKSWCPRTCLWLELLLQVPLKKKLKFQ